MRISIFTVLIGFFLLSGFTHVDFVDGPAGSLSFEQKFERRQGQKAFLNEVQRRFGHRFGRSIPEAAAGLESADGGQREFVESDVFAINMEQKTVYLLNNYRGLQVVSFEHGELDPRLVGRVEPTGNYPNKMFLDKKNERLIVLERTEDYNESRLLVYDVSDQSHPKLDESQTQVFNGRISNERFDITTGTLYVVASEYFYYWRRNNQTQKNSGYIYSFDVSTSQVSLKQRLQLSLPATGYRDMQLSEVKTEDGYKYYVVAVLNKGYRANDDRLEGFWSQDSSFVEVIDISDADQIQPSLLAAVKGQIRERSQIQIRHDTLIVVSNFNTFWRDQGPAQIAVESFQLPNPSAFSLPFNDRQLIAIERGIEAQLQQEGLSSGSAEYDNRRDELVDERLRGKHFIKPVKVVGENGVVKTVKRVFTPYAAQELVPDNPVGVNNVSLQEVRVQGDYLYAFWVPRNLKDPLEVFDISNPKNIKYRKRLAFKKGWVEKAVPFEYNGQKLIMGVGFDTEEGQSGRQLVGILAHIREEADAFRPGETRVVADEIDFRVIDDGQGWNNLNIQDKLFTIDFESAGSGTMMFPFTKIGRSNGEFNYETGAMKFAFDMEKYANGDHFFSAGSFYPQGEGYTKRVFRNTIIDRDNAFSDRELAIFGETVNFTENQRQQAVAYLELARNIQALINLDDLHAFQVISDESYSCFWRGCSNSEGETEMRLVDGNRPDAEKHDALRSLVLKGNYSSHVQVGNKAYVMTTASEKVQNPAPHGEEADYEFYTRYRIYLMNTQGAPQLVGEFRERNTTGQWDLPYVGFRMPHYYGSAGKMIKDRNDVILIMVGDQLRTIQSDVLRAHKLNCGVEQLPRMSFRAEDIISETRLMDYAVEVVDGHAYVTYKKVNKVDEKLYSENFAAPLNLSPSVSLTCETAINIPGQLVHQVGDTLITLDSWKRSNQDERIQSFASLKLNSSTATLKSMIQTSNQWNRKLHLAGHTAIEAKVIRHGDSDNEYVDDIQMQMMTLNDGAFAQPMSSSLALSSRYGMNIQSITKMSGDRHLILMSSYNRIKALRFDGNSFKALKLARVGIHGDLGPAITEQRRVGYYGSDAPQYNESRQTLQMAEGLFGVLEYKLID